MVVDSSDIFSIDSNGFADLWHIYLRYLHGPLTHLNQLSNKKQDHLKATKTFLLVFESFHKYQTF